MSFSIEDLRVLMIELDKKVDRVGTTVDYLKAKQDELNDDISKIKDPENGIFPRVKSLEEWRNTQSKISWIAGTGIIGLAVKQIWDFIIPG